MIRDTTHHRHHNEKYMEVSTCTTRDPGVNAKPYYLPGIHVGSKRILASSSQITLTHPVHDTLSEDEDWERKQCTHGVYFIRISR